MQGRVLRDPTDVVASLVQRMNRQHGLEADGAVNPDVIVQILDSALAAARRDGAPRTTLVSEGGVAAKLDEGLEQPDKVLAQGRGGPTAFEPLAPRALATRLLQVGGVLASPWHGHAAAPLSGGKADLAK